MIKEFWKRLTNKQQTNQKLTRKEQILGELERGQGTARQLSDRMGIKLSIIRPQLSALHNKGLIRDTNVDAGAEGIWEVVK
jgi:predicted ArsR family transcriptional regulator|tara:strand:+ start:632 stop:874 length:243 start_codon:yes stop_codon:yes gene_type:complete